MRILVLGGPKLDQLGIRDPETYGKQTLADVEALCTKVGAELGAEIDFRQTNDEDEMIGWIYDEGAEVDGVVINPAAWTHYSTRLREALGAIPPAVVEVHLSNIFAREPWRAHSVVSEVAKGVIVGFGPPGYELALRAIVALLSKEN